MKKLVMFASAMVLALAASAQTAVPKEFPADAAPLTAEALLARLAGNVFKVKLADGNSWRLDYKSNGYFFVDTSSGFKSSGTWRIEESKLCGALKNGSMSCNEMRLLGEALYLKRDSGEVIELARN